MVWPQERQAAPGLGAGWERRPPLQEGHDHTHTVGRRAYGRPGPSPHRALPREPSARCAGGEQAHGKEAPCTTMGAAWAHALFVWLEDGNAHRYIEGQRRRVPLLRLQAAPRAPAGVRMYAEVRQGGRGRAGGVGTRLNLLVDPERIRSGMERLIEQERAPTLEIRSGRRRPGRGRSPSATGGAAPTRTSRPPG